MNKKREPYDKLQLANGFAISGYNLDSRRMNWRCGSTGQQNTVPILNAGCVVCLWKPCWRLPNR